MTTGHLLLLNHPLEVKQLSIITKNRSEAVSLLQDISFKKIETIHPAITDRKLDISHITISVAGINFIGNNTIPYYPSRSHGKTN
ncbi:MAG TPA: hypothetical protein ENH35_01695 [Candidatus Moranbacteria bacterium]|nr:hypothetical protein [Candidatus Moranbacteria bacterium]